MTKNLVVKTNQINSSVQNLSLTEIHIIQLGIIEARETGQGLKVGEPLRIDAMKYAEMFGTTRQNAYQRLKEAEETLFNRRFSFINDRGNLVKSRWVGQVEYLTEEGAIEIIFTPAVVDGISRIDGVEQFFTSYLLEQTASMKSAYSVRLYELLAQWKTAKKTPVFKLGEFRGQLGLGVDEYKRMYDFKKYALDLAVKEINEKSDIKTKYEQVKKGRKIIGFKFSVIEQTQKQDKKNDDRDSDTVDWISGMTDKQITAFSFLLAEDDTFINKTYPANAGETMPNYTYRIAQALQDHNKQKEWAEDLKRVGFKG